MSVKLSDVAEKAGVSLTTVSRVINHDKTMNVSKETEEKIWNCVQELGYKSKKRKTKKSSKIKHIGYIVTKNEYSFDDTYFSEIIKGIETELISRKCNLSFALSAEEYREFEAIKKDNLTTCDGIIFIGDVPQEIHKFFFDSGIPAATILSGHANFEQDQISIDLYDTTYALVNVLIRSGMDRIVYIGDTAGFSPEQIELMSYEDRFRGYISAHLANKTAIDPSLMLNVNWDMETSYTKMKKLLETHTDISSVFAANDRMAIGAMRAIQEAGYNIPNDISIIGCDNIEFSQYVNPPLTTITYPKKELGQEAVRLLLDKPASASANTSYVKNVVFSAHVIERQTVSCSLSGLLTQDTLRDYRRTQAEHDRS